MIAVAELVKRLLSYCRVIVAFLNSPVLKHCSTVALTEYNSILKDGIQFFAIKQLLSFLLSYTTVEIPTEGDKSINSKGLSLVGMLVML